MSSDWTVLCVEEPTQALLVESLVETMPALNVREVAENMVLEVFDDAGTVPLAIELPRLIRNPGEVERLLAGAAVSIADGTAAMPAIFNSNAPAAAKEQPLWWQDIHVTNGQHDGGRLADALAHAIARRCSGAVVAPHQEDQ
jgi:hypothetical protein